MNLTKLFKIRIWILFAAILAGASCANVTPVTNERETADYEGNEEDNGIIGFLPDNSLEISAHARKVYNSLIDHYGGSFFPVLVPDFGIFPLGNGNYSMTLEAAQKWRHMRIQQNRERINESK